MYSFMRNYRNFFQSSYTVLYLLEYPMWNIEEKKRRHREHSAISVVGPKSSLLVP